jgi:anti-sigma factor RsiW
MTRIDDEMGKPASFEAGRTLWQRCCIAETAESESERFLDLAALADGMLDDDEHDRIAALVASDPVVMADVAAARALSTGGIAMPGGLDPIIERAIAIVAPAPERSRKIAALPAPNHRHILHGVAQWGTLAAAIAFTSWLGFTMGSVVSQTLTQPSQSNQISDENFLPELLDPSTGFLRDLGSGLQS